MTRKDYELLASVLHANKPDGDHTHTTQLWADIVYDLSIELKSTNPNFQPERFRQYCLNGHY